MALRALGRQSFSLSSFLLLFPGATRSGPKVWLPEKKKEKRREKGSVTPEIERYAAGISTF